MSPCPDCVKPGPATLLRCWVGPDGSTTARCTSSSVRARRAAVRLETTASDERKAPAPSSRRTEPKAQTEVVLCPAPRWREDQGDV
jgi:hypothetical protein